LRFERAEIRETQGGPVIATHGDHEWKTQEGKFSRLDCAASFIGFFEDGLGTGSRRYGPYSHLSCIDGIVFTDHQMFAFFDQQAADWYCYEAGRHFPNLIIQMARQA
jgi:hypothetical protein